MQANDETEEERSDDDVSHLQLFRWRNHVHHHPWLSLHPNNYLFSTSSQPQNHICCRLNQNYQSLYNSALYLIFRLHAHAQ